MNIASRSLQVYGLAPEALSQALRKLVPHESGVNIAVSGLVTHCEVLISAQASVPEKAQVMVDGFTPLVLSLLGERVYSLEGRSLEEVLATLLIEHKLNVAVAESCTGGRLAGRFTRLPGSSAFFMGGMVTYADDLKQKLLGVPPFVLKKAGAVSKDTALAMAVGLARVLDADYCLAITGLAGPGGGSPEKPIGLVHLALAGPGGVSHQECRFGDDGRDHIQERSVQAALWLLYSSLSGFEIDEKPTDRGSLKV